MSKEPIPRGRAMSSATLYATGYDENLAPQAGARHGLIMADYGCPRPAASRRPGLDVYTFNSSRVVTRPPISTLIELL
jgi:hypothetical protein